MFGYTKQIAAAAMVLTAMSTTPAMAFGLGSMARNVGTNLHQQFDIEVTGSIKPAEKQELCIGSIGSCGPKASHFSDFLIGFLDVKEREIKAVRDAFAQGNAGFSNVWTVEVPFATPAKAATRSPFMIQQIWL